MALAPHGEGEHGLNVSCGNGGTKEFNSNGFNHFFFQIEIAMMGNDIEY